MNVSSVSSAQTFQSGNVSGNRQQNQLSDDQKDVVSSVLENYDSDSLSQEDATEIASAFQAAGITPSRDLANTIAESGFSAHEIGELAGVAGGPGAVGGPPPPPPPPKTEDEENTISSLLETLLNTRSNNQNNTISDEDEEFITSLLSGYDASNISQSDAIEIDSSLKDAGIQPSRELASVLSESGFDARAIGDLAESGRPPQSSSFEKISDYTSRIISLNEDAKQEVNELFKSYSPQNTDLSRDDASKVIVNSLSQILGDSNNYKNTSFYG